MKQQGITDAFQITLEEAKQRRIAIRKQLRDLRKESDQLRKNWIRQLCKARVDQRGRGSVIGAIKSHYKTETIRNSWRKMKVVNGKMKRSKVTKTWVETTSTAPRGEATVTQRECSTKSAMEHAVMEENEERFTRCTWTSFFKGLLLSIIGFMFDGPASGRCCKEHGNHLRTMTWTPMRWIS